MPENNQHVFFVDDDLIEKLMRGDAVDDKNKKKRPASTSALAKAVSLASEGKLDEAVKELEARPGAATIRWRCKPAWAICASNSRIGLKRRALRQGGRTGAAASHRALQPGAVSRTAGKIRRSGARNLKLRCPSIPTRWQAQLSRGLCLLQLGKPEAALECIRGRVEGKSGERSRVIRQSGRAATIGQARTKLATCIASCWRRTLAQPSCWRI